MFNPLHSRTNPQLFEKRTFAIKKVSKKIADHIHYERKPSCATTKLTLFAVCRDAWDTKRMLVSP